MEDIKPIDKFTLDRYVKEEDDLLEYVEILGCKFHPDYDFIKVKEKIKNQSRSSRRRRKRRNKICLHGYNCNPRIYETIQCKST